MSANVVAIPNGDSAADIPNGYSTAAFDGAPPPSSPRPFKIFVGYDPREDSAFEVCRRSLLHRSSVPLEITPIKQASLRAAGLYWRDRGPTESTEFSFTRFLTPYLSGFDGWALFVDCDFLYLDDVAGLISLIDARYAVMCVQHDYAPTESTKMDGAVQTLYPRKNWSSMVLYNCGHPKNRVLTPELVSSQTGAFLHRFMWLDDHEIGSIPFVWNFLVGHNSVDERDRAGTYPKAIHYTLGGPWFEKYKNCEFADLWLEELEECEKEKEKKKLLGDQAVDDNEGNDGPPVLNSPIVRANGVTNARIKSNLEKRKVSKRTSTSHKSCLDLMFSGIHNTHWKTHALLESGFYP